METVKLTCWNCNTIQEIPSSMIVQEIRCVQCCAKLFEVQANKKISGMQVINISENPLINVPWEVLRGDSFISCHIVTSKRFYNFRGLKKDGTYKKSARSKKIPVVRCVPEDIAEHIVEAHNEYMHF